MPNAIYHFITYCKYPDIIYDIDKLYGPGCVVGVMVAGRL